MLCSLYLRPWVLLRASASPHVPHIANLDLVKQLLAILGKPESLITFVTDRPGHDRRYAIDPAKIAGDLGWTPEHNPRDGLQMTVDWYLSNEAWWRPLLERATLEHR